MGKLTQQESQWLDKATAEAIKGARKIALRSTPLMNTPVGRLTDHEWGMICIAAIFGWVETRVQQAVAEGRDSEEFVRITGLTPSPCDCACVKSILPALAEQAQIDWSKPLADWSQEVMTNFLSLARELMHEAEIARDHGGGKILKRAEFDEKTGEPILF
jgi:hypothetical protein